MVVEFGLGFRGATVAMSGSTGGEFRGFGIAQDLVGKVDQVPVVSGGHDLGFEMGVSKSGAGMLADEGGLFLGGQPHAWILSRHVAGFVLGSYGKDGHARSLVRLHE